MDQANISRLEQARASSDLPSPKGAALSIVRMTQRDDVSLNDLVRGVKTDPAFAGRLVKASNGVAFGRGRPVVAIQDAIQILGVPAVRSLALGFSLVSSYRSGACKSFNYLRFWSHSLLEAIAFQALTVRTRAAPADEAFSIGLLARIGELAMVTLFPQEYTKVLEAHKAVPGDAQLLRLEHESFAMTHSELTTAMLTDWGLPKLFIESVAGYESPETSGFKEGTRQYLLQQSLILASHIADICLAPNESRQEMMPRLFELGMNLSLDQNVLTGICDRVAIDWVDWSSMLQLVPGSVPSFEELAKPPQVSVENANAEAIPGELVEIKEPLRILVVEDDPVTRTLLRSHLSASGHEVLEADNGKKGFELALDFRPHILIADFSMPEMGGLELTSTLRQTKIGRAMYILLLTAKEDDNTMVEAFDAGVDDFMSKPLRSRVLAARLKAGMRVVQMQIEIERDREEIRHYAAELAISNRRLEEVAMTDALTRFPNRRYAMERMRQEWAGAQRSGRPLSCMVIDVDNFKEVNDAYGHDAGDAVLKLVADAMRTSFRSVDAVCRVGGDEFLVICPDTPMEAAVLCAERVRSAAEKLLIPVGSEMLKVSLSIGVALRNSGMSNIDSLIKSADEALYTAKRRGRNCVVSMPSGK